MQNVQAFSQSDSSKTFRHLIFLLRSIHDYDPVQSPTAVEEVTRHVLQVNRRAPPMRPRKPEETAAVKKPSPPASAGGQERQERVNKCNGCTFDMFIKSQTLQKCSDCKNECHQACCNDKGICVVCTGIKTPLPACSVCGMGDATSSCALCKKAVCPICLAGMGCCSTCLCDRPGEVIALVMDQQGVVTPKPLAEQLEKVPKKKRNAQGANKGSEPVLLTAAAGSRAKRTRKTGGAGAQ